MGPGTTGVGDAPEAGRMTRCFTQAVSRKATWRWRRVGRRGRPRRPPPSLHPAWLLVGLGKARVAGGRHGANARGSGKKTTGEGWGVGAHDCMYSTVQYMHKPTTRHRRPASCLQPPAVATGGCQHTIPHPPPQSQKVSRPSSPSAATASSATMPAAAGRPTAGNGHQPTSHPRRHRRTRRHVPLTPPGLRAPDPHAQKKKKEKKMQKSSSLAPPDASTARG